MLQWFSCYLSLTSAALVISFQQDPKILFIFTSLCPTCAEVSVLPCLQWLKSVSSVTLNLFQLWKWIFQIILTGKLVLAVLPQCAQHPSLCIYSYWQYFCVSCRLFSTDYFIQVVCHDTCYEPLCIPTSWTFGYLPSILETLLHMVALVSLVISWINYIFWRTHMHITVTYISYLCKQNKFSYFSSPTSFFCLPYIPGLWLGTTLPSKL